MTIAGKGIGLAIGLLACAWGLPAEAQEMLAPPSEVVVADAPNDAGNGLRITWQLSPDDVADADPRRVLKYEVIRRWTEPGADGAEGELQERRSLTAFGETVYLDPDCSTKQDYQYAVRALGPGNIASAEVVGSGATRPVVNWFDFGRTGFLGILLFVCGAVVVCTELARRGKPIYVRPIAGLQALEEAVGRSTEMGRPVLFVPGIVDINEIETVAGLTVLSTVARTAAEYDTQLEVPTSRTLVMTAAREIAEAAALAAGRPEAYAEDHIYYVTDEQFGYVAYVCGWMQREKPAACFYLGKFFAESLLLAETGNSIGAIQVAGTAEASQMPFFVAACDYTLIGEELFAASAYLSGEPHQLGILRGQDLGKILAAALLLIGSGLVTAQAVVGGDGLTAAVEFLKRGILG